MKLITALTFFISAFFIMPLAYMLADVQPPYEYDAEHSYIVPSTTPSGRQMLVHWHFVRVNRVCPGAITRYIVDQRTGARLSYDPTAAARTIDVGDKYLDRTFYLPAAISPGMKWYYSEGEYACNPLQRLYPLRVRTPRLSFEVKE